MKNTVSQGGQITLRFKITRGKAIFADAANERGISNGKLRNS